MKMIFAENNNVTIMNSEKEYKEVSRQKIADYCTKNVLEDDRTMDRLAEKIINHEAEVTTIVEATGVLFYLPFIERISLLPKDIILLKFENKADDVYLQVSKALYNFLNELQ